MTSIARWGNSLGVRLSKSIAREARIKEGDPVAITVKNGAIVIKSSQPAYSLEELVSKISSKNRHDETDWGRAVGREAW
jgi:antitoxin MazE